MPAINEAEVAVEVIDDWPGRGVATLLLSAIAHSAKRRGVRVFFADVRRDNDIVSHLLLVTDAEREVGHGHGSDRWTVDLDSPEVAT